MGHFCISSKPIHQFLGRPSLFSVVMGKGGVEKDGSRVRERVRGTNDQGRQNTSASKTSFYKWENWVSERNMTYLSYCFLCSGLAPFLSIINFAACMSLPNRQKKSLFFKHDSFIIRMKGSLVEIKKKKSWFKNPNSHLEQWLMLILWMACFPLVFLIRSVLCSPRLHKGNDEFHNCIPVSWGPK